MRFTYQARTRDGEVKTGIVESSTKEAALSLLEKYGLYVTLLEEAKLAPLYSRKLKFLERVSRGEIVSFSRQLAILFKSRIPIVEIFYTLG
jgi:type II secretory pathway component PulF